MIIIYNVDTMWVQRITKGIQSSDLGQSYRMVAVGCICCLAAAPFAQERVAQSLSMYVCC